VAISGSDSCAGVLLFFFHLNTFLTALAGVVVIS